MHTLFCAGHLKGTTGHVFSSLCELLNKYFVFLVYFTAIHFLFHCVKVIKYANVFCL